MKTIITVKVRLFAGLDRDLNVDDYDRHEGITLNVPERTRLKQVVKMIGLSDRYSLVYFIHGEQVGLRKRLEDGDEIACLRPAAGG
jgi:molybdopterin converting factor small subunit